MSARKAYDYVIVGGGGLRVRQSPVRGSAARVLVLEAGGRDLNPLIHIPIGLGKLHEYKMHDWGYHAEPEPNLNGRRGRGDARQGARRLVLDQRDGVHPRRSHDYDRWAQKGARGWSYADVLPYFKRVESWQDGESEHRGAGGNIGVQWGQDARIRCSPPGSSGAHGRLPVTDDYNANRAEGFGRSQYSIRDGKRCSAAVGYLRPAMKRQNLAVEVARTSTRIILGASAPPASNTSMGGQPVRAMAARR